MRKYLISFLCIGFLMMAGPVTAIAGPIEDATAAQAKGEKDLKRGERRKKAALIVKGVSQLGGALLLLMDGKLENDAPALIEELQKRIQSANELDAVKAEKARLRGLVVSTLEKGDTESATLSLGQLRALDPADSAVSYVLRTVKARQGTKK